MGCFDHMAACARHVENFERNFLYVVAGAGIAPAAGGYEPPEILLLHPAMCI
jgi:hypothetical protein